MYYTPDTIVYQDGKFCKASEVRIDFFSQTLHYGNGVFEGIRAYETPQGTRIFKAEAHYERLLFSADKMLLPVSHTVAELIELSYELLKRNELTDAYIRPLIYAGRSMSIHAGEESHLILAAFEWGRLLGNQEAHVMTSSYIRPNPKSCHVEAKVCGHYINSILAKSEARSNGYDEAILLDGDGFVAEASGANIFFEKDEVLYTPPRGNILPGITRETVMELATEMQIPVVEKQFTIDEMGAADGAFFVGTAAEIAGIGTLNGNRFAMEWEDTLGYMFSRKYLQLVTQNDQYQSTLI